MFSLSPLIDSPIASLVRSGSFMSAPKQTNIVKKGSIDGNGGASDDSMHEKYFKSVENTPVSKRKNHSLSAGSNQKHSSDSSPHSPMSPKKNVRINSLFDFSTLCHNYVLLISLLSSFSQTLRTNRPTALSSNEPFHLFKSSQDNDSLEKAAKHERYDGQRSHNSKRSNVCTINDFSVTDTWKKCEKICQTKLHRQTMPSSTVHQLYQSAKSIIYSSHRHRHQPIRAVHLVISTRIRWAKTPPEKIRPARIR